MGVGRLHPKVSLQFELNILPLEWEAIKRCIEFWAKVMRMGENRLLKQVHCKKWCAEIAHRNNQACAVTARLVWCTRAETTHVLI